MTSKTAMIQELNNIEARIHQKLRLEFEELFVDELTDKQHIVLNFIEQKGGSSPIQIAQQLGITQSAVSQLLNTLEKKEWIRRSINPNNRRELHVELSEKAKTYLENMRKVELAIIEKYYSALSFDEISTLTSIYEKLDQLIPHQNEEKGGE
ncbi:MarR family transcriptional regulator [Bacillus safensis FO-36b]|uniref:MarR family winged helix-turn-helix transcriptional regulator n=2 Tax=Bacillus TaxID=1386 RepID=UPI00045CC601|nr:MarR family transcriptional regulator [Bacillus safensis]MBY0190404.1 MarR family transcriptional regulator [Bacillus aerophilus]AWI37471.1 transcriptional regulator [Bacillus safensis FO-36b]KDE29211.1 MarR family transcriptional regulator [Bacillus safensis FO-36b]MCM3049375.1 MarR family transcriptional regulator [Bacillus safensis]MDP4565308.1 MarR family transcriptional regulator [Bacillus safensis]